jgi:4'-phosphopantetheinyl transferase
MHWLVVGEHTIPDGTDWLSPREAARAAGMRFTKRRTEYRLRRLAGKRAVAAALGRPTDAAGLASIQLLNRPGGAPYVVVDGAEVPMDVSLTDRADRSSRTLAADVDRRAALARLRQRLLHAT